MKRLFSTATRIFVTIMMVVAILAGMYHASSSIPEVYTRNLFSLLALIISAVGVGIAVISTKQSLEINRDAFIPFFKMHPTYNIAEKTVELHLKNTGKGTAFMQGIKCAVEVLDEEVKVKESSGTVMASQTTGFLVESNSACTVVFKTSQGSGQPFGLMSQELQNENSWISTMLIQYKDIYNRIYEQKILYELSGSGEKSQTEMIQTSFRKLAKPENLNMRALFPRIVREDKYLDLEKAIESSLFKSIPVRIKVGNKKLRVYNAWFHYNGYPFFVVGYRRKKKFTIGKIGGIEPAEERYYATDELKHSPRKWASFIVENWGIKIPSQHGLNKADPEELKMLYDSLIRCYYDSTISKNNKKITDT